MQERIVTVDSEGLVTIPIEIRTMLGIPTGGLVAFIVHDDGYVELRSPPFTLDIVFEFIAALPNETRDLDAEIASATEEWIAQRYRTGESDCEVAASPVR